MQIFCGDVLWHYNRDIFPNKCQFYAIMKEWTESLQKICKALNCDVGDICVVNEVSEK